MAGENIVTVSEQNFAQEVVQSPVPVLVDFWAEWCGPCKMIAPSLNELATEYAGRAKVAKVNVDDNQDLAVKFHVSGIPALFVIKNGEVVDQATGARSKRDLKAMLDRALA